MTGSKKKYLDYEDIEKKILPEIEAAKEYADLRVDRRNKAWDRYRGKPLGNEIKGRSRFVTREVLDTVEWMMPYFMRSFASGDPKIDLRIQGQESWVGKGLLQEMIKRIDSSSPTLFLLLYTWIKDLLVSDSSFIKLSWVKDYEDVDAELPPELSSEEMQVLEEDENFTITSRGTPVKKFSDTSAMSMGMGSGEGGMMPPSPVAGGVPVFTMPVEQTFYTGVKAKIRKKVKDTISAQNTPHMEFIAHSNASDINDEYGKGHKTEVTLDYLKRIDRAMGGDYFRDLDELHVDMSGIEAGTTSSTGETDEYFNDEHAKALLTGGGYSGTAQDPKGKVEYIEWYTREDVDEDGYLEDIVCYLANNKLIRWEINEEGIIPFVHGKPIIDPFKFYGISYADLIIEIQNLKTMIIRRILDNFDFQNLGRWLVDPQACVDKRALLDNRPNSIVTGKIEGVKNLFNGAFNPNAGISILEYVDKMKENRTGVHGLQPDLNSGTATEIHHLETTTIQRLELIGRIVAEVGLKDFYYKGARLFQIYLEEPFTINVDGAVREITPDMIQGDIITNVNMGVEASVGLQDCQRIQIALGVLAGLNQQYPGLMGPEQIHRIAEKFVWSSGFKQSNDFIVSLDEFKEATQQAQEAQAKMQEQMMQMQQQLEQMDLMIKGKEVEVKASKAEADKEIRSAGVIQKDRASERDFIAKQSKLATERNKI